jgi:hypothetical protein
MTTNIFNLSGASFQGGWAGRDYTGDINSSNRPLSPIALRLQKLISDICLSNSPLIPLDQSTAMSQRLEIASLVIAEIEKDKEFKEALIQAYFGGLLKPLKTNTNPINIFVIRAIGLWEASDD